MNNELLLPQDVSGNRGTAMIVAMFCLFMTSLAAVSISSLVNQQLNMGNVLMNRNQASQVANGALELALAKIAVNPAGTTLPETLVSGSMGKGTYNVQLTPITDSLILATATGTVGTMTQVIKTYVQKPTFYSVLNKGIFSNDYVDISGSGTESQGTFSNTRTSVWGSTVILTGSVDSALTSTVGGAAVVTSGIIRSGVPRMAMPQLDFEYYYRIAAANNQVIPGPLTINNNLEPPGGVIWVVGNVTLASGTVKGSVFATGSIYTQGQSSVISPSAKFPSLVSINGKIDFQGGSTFSGLIYCKTGIVDVHGNCTIKGSIVAFGYVLCRGNWGALEYAASDPMLTDDPKVHVLAWEQ